MRTTGDADAVLARIETRVSAEAGALPPAVESARVVPQGGGLGAMVSPDHRGRAVLFISIWIVQTLRFYGFMSWVPTLLVANGFSVVHSLERSSAISIGAVPGAWIAAMISDRWERKWLITIVAVVVGSCGMIYGLSFRTATIVIFGFLVAMSLQIFAPLLYAYTAESFPTPMRNTATGVAHGTGRLANVVGAMFIAFLSTTYGYTSVFAYIAICWAVVAILVAFFGPHTRGQRLA